MTTGATGQLGLALPVQGELSGTWGDTVNNGITQYTNIAIAATLTLTNDGAVTLANTTGDASASNITSTLTGAGTVTAQFAIVRVTGTLTVAKVVTAPSYSKTYTVVNAATGGIVTFKAAGQTGVSIAVGESAFVYFNGTDYVKVSSTVATGVTSFTAGTTGLTPNTATTGAVTLAGTLATANGGTNLGGATPFTSGGVVYASSTSALATGSALTFSGTDLGISVSGSTGLALTSSASQAYINLRSVVGGGFEPFIGFGDTSAGNIGGMNGITGGGLAFSTSGSEKMRILSGGNVGIGTSSPANNLHVYGGNASAKVEGSGSTNSTQFSVKNTTSSFFMALDGNAGGAFGTANAAVIWLDSANPLIFGTNNSQRAQISSVGNVLIGGTAARGTTVGAAHLDLFNGTAPAGTLTNGISLYSDSGDLKFMNAAGDAFDVGYRNIPQNSQSAAYTLVLADAGKHIFHPVGDNNARTFTIPANSSVAYPVGTAITFINMAVANVTIAITTDTLTLSPAGTSGSRTLATNGSATCIKITSTQWLISGSGLT